MINTEKLNAILEKGETVQWSGTPQPYSLLDESRKKSTYYTLCWAIGWAVVTIGAYYALVIAPSGSEVQKGVVGFLLIISLFIVWMPISDKSKIKKLTYAITNQRVIIIPHESTNLLTMRFAQIDGIRIDQADHGNCHVRIGSQTFKAAPRKLPSLAYLGRFTGESDNKTYTGMVFFNVSADDAKTISNLLEPVVSTAKKAA